MTNLAFHLKPQSDVRHTFELEYDTDLASHKVNQTALVVRACHEIRRPDGSWKRFREDLYYELTITVGVYGPCRGELERAEVVAKQMGDWDWVEFRRPAWSSLEGWLRGDREVAKVVDRVWEQILDDAVDARGDRP